MHNFDKTKEIEQKKQEEIESDIQNIKNQIKSLLKCDICNINFDLNIHMPMVAKCGHTYCKKCIYNGGSKESYGKCPIDNIHHVLGIESCVPNLKLEVIIKQIFNYSEPKIKEKKIICFNHEIKLNNNSKEKVDENKLFRSNSGNKNFNFLSGHDELFNNVFTDKKNKTITNFKINKNKEKKICNLKLYNNDNVDVIEELNVMTDDKINFTGENKINDESIETIPINDEKSNANISFKDEFNELLNKKSSKKIISDENIKNNEDKTNNEAINNDNNHDNYNSNKMNMSGGNINNNDENNNSHDNFSKHSSVNNNKIYENNNNEIINKKNINNKLINDNESKEINNDINKNINNNIINKGINNNKNSFLSEIQRNSINFMKKKKKIEIDAIDEIDEYFLRPRTITFSKNIDKEKKTEKKPDNKNIAKKIENYNIKNAMKEIKKLSVYEKISFKKRKTISQENIYRNRKMSIKINTKNKSEEKGREKINNLKNFEKEQMKGNIDKDKKEINDEKEDNNISDIYLEDEKNKPSEQKYRILSKKIGLKKHPENDINHSNSNSNDNSNCNSPSPINCKNNSEEKNNFVKPLKKKSSLNSYFRANKLLIKNRNEVNKNNCNFISNEISSFQKKKYIDNKINNMNDYSSNSYHKTKSTYNKKKLKGKSNLFLRVKNNYNISLNNSNNNINSINTINNNTNNPKEVINQNNTNIIQHIQHAPNSNNNINRIKGNKISLSMSPNNKENIGNNNYNLSPIFSQLTDNKNNYYKNNIHSTRDISNFNNNFNGYSKDINGIIKTITIKRVNSFATKNIGNQNMNKIEEKNNINVNDKKNNNNAEDINEINNKLRFEFNRVFNYQINLYENMKDAKNKQILLERNKKYKSILEEFINQKNNKDLLKSTEICFLSDGEFFIGQKESDLPKYGITYNLSGDYYKGGFFEGKKDGNGIMIYKNGTKYEGNFKNNKHEGFGKLKQLDGETFIGEWKDGKINGNGVRCHCNGDRYIGSYVNNIRNGHGIYTFSNGDSYEGNWLNGKATGKGIFKFKNGDIYEGEFKSNIIMGHGNFETKNGDVYSGIFKNGLINGKGLLTYQNGEKYVGFFKNGKKDGIGKIYDKSGKVYKTGYWKNDKYLGNKYI